MSSFEFFSEVVILDSNVWNGVVFVPDDVVCDIRALGYKRLLCKYNDSFEKSTALTSNGDGRYYFHISIETIKKVNTKFGGRILVSVKEDTSKYGMEMPIELESILELDIEGSEFFHQLTPGKQRNLIYLVATPKSIDLKIKKAEVIVEYLKKVEGRLDFKELNQAFKERNQLG